MHHIGPRYRIAYFTISTYVSVWLTKSSLYNLFYIKCKISFFAEENYVNCFYDCKKLFDMDFTQTEYFFKDQLSKIDF